MQRPNFFIIGAPKCGTSTFINELRWHPNIYVPLAYEPQWFSTDFSAILDHNEQSYLDLFAGVQDKHIAVGEKSVIYMYSQVAIDNILKFNPDSRFIIMLRNPVDLVYSWHSQLYYTFIEHIESFEEAWALQESRQRGENIGDRCPVPFSLQYREIGSLGKYLQKAQEKIPAGRLKIIFMEDFHADPEKVYREGLEFLGVPYAPRADVRKLNVNKRHRWRWLGLMLAHDSKSRGNRLIKRIDRLPLLRRFHLKYRLHEFNKVVYKREPLNPEFRKHLLDEFSDDIQLLAQLTGRDLSHWMQ